MAKTKSPFVGHWRLTEMDEWDNDFMDAEAPAMLIFEPNSQGGFTFGYVTCWIDYQLGERDGQPAAEWTFDGHDEGDDVYGRGWAVLEADGTLRGHLFFHNGDDSGFKAKPMPVKPKKVNGKKAGKPKLQWVRAADIKDGPIRHETLPDDLLERARAIHAAIKDVYSTTLEQMEIKATISGGSKLP